MPSVRTHAIPGAAHQRFNPPLREPSWGVVAVGLAGAQREWWAEQVCAHTLQVRTHSALYPADVDFLEDVPSAIAAADAAATAVTTIDPADPSTWIKPWNTFDPPKSFNLAAAPAIISYVNHGYGDHWTLGIDDAHSGVGVELANSPGAVVIAGSGKECGDHCVGTQSPSFSDGLAIKYNADGTTAWEWKTGRPGESEQMTGVVELPNGEILLAGWRMPNNVGTRVLTKLSAAGTKIWDFTDFGGDDATHHGAIELVTMAGQTHVLLAGFKNKPDNLGWAFKSGGNCEYGQAWLAKMPVSALSKSTPPSRSDIVAENTEPRYDTAKAAYALPDGTVVSLMWRAQRFPGHPGAAANGEPAKSAGIIRWSSDFTDSWWGPIEYGTTQLLEGTDLTISKDGSKIALTGHGKFKATGKYYSGKLVVIDSEDGKVLSYTEVNAGGIPELIYNECWGVVAQDDGFVVACGTGIENCGHKSAANMEACKAGKGDPSTPNMSFPPGVWQSMSAKVDLSGNLLWRRVDAFGGPFANCREGCTTFTAPGSSASEWVILNKDGSLTFVQDESSGFGVMRLAAPTAATAAA